jgi:hypothetical protein
MPKSETPVTLLDFVPEELAELTEIKAARDEKQKQVREIERAIDNAETALARAQSGVVPVASRRAALAEAALAGKPLPAEPPRLPGPQVGDLQLTIDGLRAKLEGAREREAAHHGRLRVKHLALFPLAAERAAVEYLKTTRSLSQLHAVIGACNEVCTGIDPRQVLFGPEWWRVMVPSSSVLRPLIGKARQVWGQGEVLWGGDTEGTIAASTKALQAAKAGITELLGEWPLDPRR